MNSIFIFAMGMFSAFLIDDIIKGKMNLIVLDIVLILFVLILGRIRNDSTSNCDNN